MARFTRTTPAPNVKGGYRAYRPYVRSDFAETCAYCLFPEIWAGGKENFELDHFCPASVCKDRVNDFFNLYYSCHPCNHIKWGFWPSDEERSRGFVYIDFCKDNFADHYRELPDGRWEPLTPAAEYTLLRLKLNRKHLVNLRNKLKSLSVSPPPS